MVYGNIIIIISYPNYVHGYIFWLILYVLPYIADGPSDSPLKNRVMKYIRLDLLDLNTLIPLLNKHGLLTRENLYVLKNQKIPSMERANALVYHILPSKGPGAFTLFVKCLEEEKEHMGHQKLVRLFTLPVECEEEHNISDQKPTVEVESVQCVENEQTGGQNQETLVVVHDQNATIGKLCSCAYICNLYAR